MKKNEESAESDSKCKQEYDIMSSQITKAVEEMPADDSTITDEPGKEIEAGEAAETQPKELPPKDDGDGEGAFSVGDAEIERAVKAGLSVADARAFTDKGVFERVCAALEAKNAPDGKISKDSGKDAKDGDEESADFDVPELTEDEEFDPKLVKLSSAVRKMGDALKAMREENRTLREAVGRSKEERDAERAAARAAAVEDRKNLRIAKPGGVPGTRKAKTEEDVLAEVAGELSSKFGI